MKSKKLIEVIKAKDLVIPSILLANYKELNINEKELLFLALLMSYENSICFDPVHFSKILGCDVNEIIELIYDEKESDNLAIYNFFKYVNINL